MLSPLSWNTIHFIIFYFAYRCIEDVSIRWLCPKCLITVLDVHFLYFFEWRNNGWFVPHKCAYFNSQLNFQRTVDPNWKIGIKPIPIFPNFATLCNELTAINAHQEHERCPCPHPWRSHFTTHISERPCLLHQTSICWRRPHPGTTQPQLLHQA